MKESELRKGQTNTNAETVINTQYDLQATFLQGVEIWKYLKQPTS